jgi:hypothetical protein
MPTWMSAVIAIGAIASTYFFCVRPGLRGRCAAGGTGAPHISATASRGDDDLDRQLAQLREDIRVLHAQDLLDAGQAAPKSVPPRES